MDAAPEALELRRMHARELGPMREKLTWFLSGWLGGPALYAERNEGSVCITQAHRPYSIDERARDQWMWCMKRALESPDVPEGVRRMVEAPLTRVADFLRNR